MICFHFSIAVLGCRANQEEMDVLRSHLLELGGQEVGFPGPADVAIVNTCAVTATAQAQSGQEIRKAARVKRGGLLIATGCGAQLDPLGLARINGVDLVVGNRGKPRLVQFMRRFLDGREGSLGLAAAATGVHSEHRLRSSALDTALARAGLKDSGDVAGRICWQEDPTPERFVARAGTIPRRRTRALLRIQDGCRYRCGFCIVSRLRGRPRSRDLEEVIEEAGHLVDAGFREIVLTGINLGLYGLGLSRAHGRRGHRRYLATLLRRLEGIDGLRRIRLSSLEPMTISDDLLDQIAVLPKVARHFHIPFQSGDDELLRGMKRPYDVAFLEALIARIARRMPRFGLGVDIVAGFPGETDKAFSRTLALLSRLPVSYIHAFAYSERPGTPAASLGQSVLPPVRKQRVRMLRELDERLRRRHQQRLEGRHCRLLVEQVEDSRFSGLNGEYMRMTGEAPGILRGSWIEVIAGAPLTPRLQSCSLAEDP